jgi:hypothetical protein
MLERQAFNSATIDLIACEYMKSTVVITNPSILCYEMSE